MFIDFVIWKGARLVFILPKLSMIVNNQRLGIYGWVVTHKPLFRRCPVGFSTWSHCFVRSWHHCEHVITVFSQDSVLIKPRLCLNLNDQRRYDLTRHMCALTRVMCVHISSWNIECSYAHRYLSAIEAVFVLTVLSFEFMCCEHWTHFWISPSYLNIF